MKKFPLFSFVRIVFGPIIRALYGVRYQGRELVPKEGAVVIVCNHVQAMDPTLIVAGVPRTVSFLAKEELYCKKLIRFFLLKLATVPVARHRADLASVRTCMERLGSGGAVGVFPEGTRSHSVNMAPFEPGAALLAYRSGALVVPAAISGPYKAFGKGVCVRFGEPFRLEPQDPKRLTKDDLKAGAQRMYAAVSGLMRNNH